MFPTFKKKRQIKFALKKQKKVDGTKSPLFRKMLPPSGFEDAVYWTTSVINSYP